MPNALINDGSRASSIEIRNPVCPSRTSKQRIVGHPCPCFLRHDFTEVVFKPMVYGLSGRVCQFLFLAMSRSGRQRTLKSSELVRRNGRAYLLESLEKFLSVRIRLLIEPLLD